MPNTTPTTWWAQTPTTPFGTPTNITLATGARDVEKGNIYAVPAGGDISLPERTKLVWADSQHAVLQDTEGNFINLLHVNPTAPVGSVIEPNTPFAKVSGVVGSITDPTSKITYTETGNIVELGLYSTKQGAINREVLIGGQDQPYNFSGIYDPTSLINQWKSGQPTQTQEIGTTPDTPITPSPGTPITPSQGISLLDTNPLSLLTSKPQSNQDGQSGGITIEPWMIVAGLLLLLVWHLRR